jgi:hypothetical protein
LRQSAADLKRQNGNKNALPPTKFIERLKISHLFAGASFSILVFGHRGHGNITEQACHCGLKIMHMGLIITLAQFAFANHY